MKYLYLDEISSLNLKLLLNQSNLLLTALTLDLLKRIAASVHASTKPLTSAFNDGSEAFSIGI